MGRLSIVWGQEIKPLDISLRGYFASQDLELAGTLYWEHEKTKRGLNSWLSCPLRRWVENQNALKKSNLFAKK